MGPVETRYARNGDVRIAYQIVGQGDLDLVLVPGLVSHLDLVWEEPEHARFCEELAAFTRLIMFDKRGTGLSDRDCSIAGIEDRMADATAVMDAAGSRRAGVFGFSEGGKMALMFAATYPERVRALALYGAFAQSPTQAWPPDQVEARFALMERTWGMAMLPPSVAPSKETDHAFRRRWARFERCSASPATAGALLRMDHAVDVTAVLPEIRVPTLVMHREGDQRIAVSHARHLAAHIPEATYVELPGADHLPYIGDRAQVIAEVRQLLAGLHDG